MKIFVVEQLTGDMTGVFHSVIAAAQTREAAQQIIDGAEQAEETMTSIGFDMLDAVQQCTRTKSYRGLAKSHALQMAMRYEYAKNALKDAGCGNLLDRFHYAYGYTPAASLDGKSPAYTINEVDVYG